MPHLSKAELPRMTYSLPTSLSYDCKTTRPTSEMGQAKIVSKGFHQNYCFINEFYRHVVDRAMISPLNKLKLVADLFGDQLIRNTRRVNIEIGDFSSFIRYRPRRDKDEIRHERRYGALEKG